MILFIFLKAFFFIQQHYDSYNLSSHFIQLLQLLHTPENYIRSDISYALGNSRPLAASSRAHWARKRSSFRRHHPLCVKKKWYRQTHTQKTPNVHVHVQTLKLAVFSSIEYSSNKKTWVSDRARVRPMPRFFGILNTVHTAQSTTKVMTQPVRWKLHGHAGNARRKVIKNREN